MGDRANIMVVDRPAENGAVHGIYLYTHSSGYHWPEMLRKALASPEARRRWNDDTYLTRIVVSQMYMDIHDSEYGGGISTYRTDNEYPITILDIPNQQVAWADEGGELDTEEWYGRIGFPDFVALERAEYPHPGVTRK